ncbi:MAG: hypothetical protein ACI857_000187 [Arenicella sp.]|jgi:hypothetical protein
MKKVLSILVLTVVFLSCNKDQSAVKKLDGTWDLTKMEIEADLFGVPIKLDLIGLGGSGTMSFDNCKLADDEWCNVSSVTVNPLDSTTVTANDLYRVTNDGTKLETKTSDTASTSTIMTINELTKSFFSVSWSMDEGDIDAELSKQ